MPRKSVPTPHAGGRWTEARYNSFIKSNIRSMSQRWAPIYDCKKMAFTEEKTNVKTGRKAQHFECACCKKDFPSKDVVVDHIEPVVPITGFTTWDDIIKRTLVEIDGLQVLCKDCHQIKSNAENEQRRQYEEAASASTDSDVPVY